MASEEPTAPLTGDVVPVIAVIATGTTDNVSSARSRLDEGSVHSEQFHAPGEAGAVESTTMGTTNHSQTPFQLDQQPHYGHLEAYSQDSADHPSQAERLRPERSNRGELPARVSAARDLGPSRPPPHRAPRATPRPSAAATAAAASLISPLPNKTKVSHARKTAPGHIKRPPNAFILFRSHCCAPNVVDLPSGAPGTPSTQQLADLGITDHRHISRIVSHLWKSLPAHEKKYWDTKAQEKKEEHQRMYPDYRYKPVYRNKDDVRKRRKGAEVDVEEEKRGCEQVALALMGPDAQPPAATDDRWTIDTVVGAIANGDQIPNRPPRKKPSRAKKPLGKAIALAEEGRAGNEAARVLFAASRGEGPSGPMPDDDDDGEDYPLDDMGDVVGYGDSYNDSGQGPSKRPRIFQESQPDHRQMYQSSSLRRGPPAALDLDHEQRPLPYNPSFQYYPTAADANKSLQHHYQQYTSARPPSPGSLGSMQRYSFGAPLAKPPPGPLIPIVNPFPDNKGGQESSLRGSEVVPAARSPMPASALPLVPIQIPATAPEPIAAEAIDDSVVFVGMQRRGTFSRTSDGGNLMLVSPRGGGRTFSLARWDVKREGSVERAEADLAHSNGQSTPINAAFSVEPPLTAFSFDPEFLSAAQDSAASIVLNAPSRSTQSVDSILSDGDAHAQFATKIEDNAATSRVVNAFVPNSEAWHAQRAGQAHERDLRYGLLSPSCAAAMEILDRSNLKATNGGSESGGENRNYLWLTVPQASEPLFVDQVLKAGWGIAYDHIE